MADSDSKSKLDNLRDKPKDQKTAIAGGIAFAVVAILLIAWAIWFLRKIANENSAAELQSGPDFSHLQQGAGEGWWGSSEEGSTDSTFGTSRDAYSDTGQSYSDGGSDSY